MIARPFIKWAGGKTGLLPELLARAPESFGTYHEPFLGGGALFFALQPKKAVLSDINSNLIDAYQTVRDRVEDVIKVLKKHKSLHCESHYYTVRRLWNDGYHHPANFIYLNKTCYNGLWRVNKQGAFNVPFGKYKNPRILDAENLRSCSEALKNARILCQDFRRSALIVKPGDFWYADPPYAPLSATSSFTSYAKDGFTEQDQFDLHEWANSLKLNGVHVLLSNSSAWSIRELYCDTHCIKDVKARRAINSKGSKRGKITEVIIS